MLIDHVGFYLFPQIEILRVIGRIAFPIFAFLIAEGCRYTRTRLRYFMTIFISGLVFFVVTYLFTGEIFYNVFLNFSIAILCIYLLEYLKKIIFAENVSVLTVIALSFAYVLVLVAAYVTFRLLPIEYGFFGMLIPVLVSLTDLRPFTDAPAVKYIDNHGVRIIVTALLLISIHLTSSFPLQIFSLLSVPFLLFYNGKAGSRRLKYFFYAFYPAHIIIICAIKQLFLN